MSPTYSTSTWINGIGFIAPGLPDWPSTADVLTGRQSWASAPSVLPAPALLPPAERRRASRVIRLALALGYEAVTHAKVDATHLATVFAASGADGHNAHALCEQLASDDRQISPTRFHNSVHNAAAGYWSIATRSMAPSQVLSAYDGSFGAGLLDAVSQVAISQAPVLLIAYDSEYPEPLHAKRPIPDAAGLALVLTPVRTTQSLAQLTVAWAANRHVTTMSDSRLDGLRQQFPALRALPALSAIARREPGRLVIDYLPGLMMDVGIQPC